MKITWIIRGHMRSYSICSHSFLQKLYNPLGRGDVHISTYLESTHTNKTWWNNSNDKPIPTNIEDILSTYNPDTFLTRKTENHKLYIDKLCKHLNYQPSNTGLSHYVHIGQWLHVHELSKMISAHDSDWIFIIRPDHNYLTDIDANQLHTTTADILVPKNKWMTDSGWHCEAFLAIRKSLMLEIIQNKTAFWIPENIVNYLKEPNHRHIPEDYFTKWINKLSIKLENFNNLRFQTVRSDASVINIPYE